MTDHSLLESWPPQFQEIVAMFQDAPGQEKLELLLEFAMDLPDLPAHLQDHRADMEQVDECQTPFFLASEVKNGKIKFYYDVPMEGPTIRGFASILAQGLVDSTPEDILNIPPDIHVYLGLQEVMSPLRLRGMQAVLSRMKRQAGEHLSQSG